MEEDYNSENTSNYHIAVIQILDSRPTMVQTSDFRLQLPLNVSTCQLFPRVGTVTTVSPPLGVDHLIFGGLICFFIIGKKMFISYLGQFNLILSRFWQDIF